jgi:hypothetical protein
MNAEAFGADIAFYPTFGIGSYKGPFAPRDCNPGHSPGGYIYLAPGVSDGNLWIRE